METDIEAVPELTNKGSEGKEILGNSYIRRLDGTGRNTALVIMSRVQRRGRGGSKQLANSEEHLTKENRKKIIERKATVISFFEYPT